MAEKFDYFVIFAAMRTGSNFLEDNINEVPGLTCHGEVFNPHFVGHANKKELMGVSLQQREADPVQLLDRMRVHTEGLPGFRFFFDHDPRILRECLENPRCAKIVLTRNPIDSYVSRKIAAATGQWRLNDLKNAKTAQVTFEADEFANHLETLQDFQLTILKALQITGQTAFYIGYDDLRDLDVLDGLTRFLGLEHKKERTTKRTKVQNPSALDKKVTNFDEMQASLGLIDRFDLTRTPNFEPRRSPSVPSYVAAAKAPALYQPIKAGPERRVLAWMAALDDQSEDDLQRGFSQKTLRQWKRQNNGHRSFSVVRHPVTRLHAAFVTHIMGVGDDTYWEIRETLRNNFKMPLPDGPPDKSYSVAQHKEAILAFAHFVKGNLGGQTGLRVDAAWASQTEGLLGMSQVILPDMILREEKLEQGLGQLAEQIGREPIPVLPYIDDSPVPLADIYDDSVEQAVRAAYQKDYMMFGFGSWSESAG